MKKGILFLVSLLFLSSISFAQEKKYRRISSSDLDYEWHCGAEFQRPKPGHCYFVIMAHGKVLKKVLVDENKMVGNSDFIVKQVREILKNPDQVFHEINFD